MEENKSDWLTVADVAAELGFSPSTVYGWIDPADGSEPRLVAHRIGNSWRVNRAALDAFIAAGRNVPALAQEGVTP